MKKILIVGAGYAGSVFGRLAAEQGSTVQIIDKNDHIGGHSYSFKDVQTGIEIHKYGPHIFHTNYEDVYSFITRFSKLNNYINRVKVIHDNQVYSMPINLHTINQFFEENFSPLDARQFIESKQVRFDEITNFKEVILNSIGEELYEAFFKGYTKKQWGCEPEKIVASTAKRLPIRYNYNDNYFNDKYQGIPVNGYGSLFENILDHRKISITLNTDFNELKETWRKDFDFLVFTGAIDDYFDHCIGVLPYRSLRFERIDGKEIQGNAVINYPDADVPYTRIHEHKYFTPGLNFDNSVAFKEFSLQAGKQNKPFYPIENESSLKLYNRYKEMAEKESEILFLGRLAQFKYYNMDQVIKSAIDTYNNFTKRR